MHLEASLLKDRVKQIADVVVILNHHGHAKFAHDYPISGKTTAPPSAMRKVLPDYIGYNVYGTRQPKLCICFASNTQQPVGTADAEELACIMAPWVGTK
ncbi:hypothetical protein GCM10009589_23770 [Arthrobacter pascens]